MLEKQDKKEIEKIVRNVFSEGVEKLINPQFDGVNKKIDGLEDRVGGLEDRVGDLEDKVDGMDRKLDVVIRVQDKHSIKIGKM